MKKTIVIFLSLVIGALIITLPYKGFTTFFFGSTGTTAMYENIVAIFKHGIWLNVVFLFVLFPTVLLFQIRRSPFTVYKMLLFLIEETIAILAAFIMYCFMTFSVLEENVVLKPMFYLSLTWVLGGAFASILLAKKTTYDKAVTLIYSQ